MGCNSSKTVSPCSNCWNCFATCVKRDSSQINTVTKDVLGAVQIACPACGKFIPAVLTVVDDTTAAIANSAVNKNSNLTTSTATKTTGN